MKVTLPVGKLQFELEGDTQVELFEEMARTQEVFASQTCGLCKKDQVKFVVRTNDTGSFYEMKCCEPKCGAVLSFGVHNNKNGTLFPHRKDKEKQWLPNNGWTKYDPKAKEQK